MWLYDRTRSLFAMDDKILLFDLTNTYFKGRMSDSELCKYGRRKEKRSDCPLVALGAVVNTQGMLVRHPNAARYIFKNNGILQFSRFTQKNFCRRSGLRKFTCLPTVLIPFACRISTLDVFPWVERFVGEAFVLERFFVMIYRFYTENVFNFIPLDKTLDFVYFFWKRRLNL